MTATNYARTLLDTVAVDHAARDLSLPAEPRSAADLWADSGAMFLTGRPAEPPRMSQAPLAMCARGAWLALSALRPDQFSADAPAHRLLGERAAIFGFTRNGRISAGGRCHLLATNDGLIALNLARDEDMVLLDAWLETAGVTFANLSHHVANRSSGRALATGAYLGARRRTGHANTGGGFLVRAEPLCRTR